MLTGPGRRHETGIPAGLVASVERSLLDVLHGEIARSFDPDACEEMGLSVGHRLVLRMQGPAPLAPTLDIFKFLCKEVWIELYAKKIDRLQTNHRGVFMCTDLAFLPLAKLKREHDTSRFLALHKGLVRGALANLGVNIAHLSVDVLPAAKGASPDDPLGCCFTVTVHPA
jgi:hypothetical protein